MTYINKKYNDGILLFPFRGTAVAGTWVWVNDNRYLYSGFFRNSSSNVNDEYEYTHVKLKRGNYKITVHVRKDSDKGIITISYNGNVILTSDLYYGSHVFNHLVSDTFTLTTDTDATLDFKVLSKNASSTGHYINFAYIKIEKTD